MGGIDGRSWRHATEGLDGWGTGFTEVQAVAALGDTLVAVGSSLSRPVAWTSPDAMTWTAVDSGHGLGNRQHDWPTGIATRPAGAVAVGRHQIIEQWSVARPDYPVAWSSQDGVEWVRLAAKDMDGAAFHDVVAVDPWLVAVGSVVDEGAVVRPAAWFATPGTAWQTVDLTVAGYDVGQSSVNTVARSGSGLLVGGMVQGMPELWVWSSTGSLAGVDSTWKRPETGRWNIRDLEADIPFWSAGRVFDRFVAFDDRTMWLSEDGVDWSSVPIADVGLEPDRGYHQPAVVGNLAYVIDEAGTLWSSPDGDYWQGRPTGLEGWLEGPFPGIGDELLLVQHGWETETPRLYRSTDGVVWTEMSVPEVEWLSEVHVFGDLYVTTGWSFDGPSLWVSADGEVWEETHLGETGDLNPVVVSGQRILVLSVDHAGFAPATSVFVSSDGREWERFEVDLPGWPGDLVAYEHGFVLTVFDAADGNVPRPSVWVSPEGANWTQLGPLPIFGESWARPLPAGDSIRVIVEGENQPPTLWEWVPPEED